MKRADLCCLLLSNVGDIQRATRLLRSTSFLSSPETKIGSKEQTANLSVCAQGRESAGFAFSISHVCSFMYSQLIPFNGTATYGEAAAG